MCVLKEDITLPTDLHDDQQYVVLKENTAPPLGSAVCVLKQHTAVPAGFSSVFVLKEHTALDATWLTPMKCFAMHACY